MNFFLSEGEYIYLSSCFFFLLLSILIFLRSEKKSGSLMWIMRFLASSSVFFFFLSFEIFHPSVSTDRKEFNKPQIKHLTKLHYSRRVFLSGRGGGGGGKVGETNKCMFFASSQVKNFQRQFTTLLQRFSTRRGCIRICRWVFIHSGLF